MKKGVAHRLIDLWLLFMAAHEKPRWLTVVRWLIV